MDESNPTATAAPADLLKDIARLLSAFGRSAPRAALLSLAAAALAWLAAAALCAALFTPAEAAAKSTPNARPAAEATSSTAATPSTTPSATAAPSPVKSPSGLDPQTDEGAGKEADLSKIATSPRDGSPYLGPKDALVVVNIFSDFQCPVCSRAADPIKQLVLDFPGKVKVFFRNNALEMHGRSKPAALAALAAGKQGKFWQYHDRLFSNQRALDDSSLRQIALDLGLDLAQWEKDRADPKSSERIQQEAAEAVKLGASGTPGLFVNGIRQVGWGSYQGLKAFVVREIAAGEELEAAGTPKAQIPASRIRAMADKNTKKEGEAIDPDPWVKALTAD